MAHYHDPWIGVPDDRSGPTKPGCWYPECNCEREGSCEHALTAMFIRPCDTCGRIVTENMAHHVEFRKWWHLHCWKDKV